VEKQYFERVAVALIIQRANRMRRVTLSRLACLPLPYFPTISHKRHDFWKKGLPNIKCVFIFSLQLLFEIFFILKIIQRDIIVNIHSSSCKVSIIRVMF
jgi:hypothetical protein